MPSVGEYLQNLLSSGQLGDLCGRTDGVNSEQTPGAPAIANQPSDWNSQLLNLRLQLYKQAHQTPGEAPHPIGTQALPTQPDGMRTQKPLTEASVNGYMMPPATCAVSGEKRNGRVVEHAPTTSGSNMPAQAKGRPLRGTGYATGSYAVGDGFRCDEDLKGWKSSDMGGAQDGGRANMATFCNQLESFRIQDGANDSAKNMSPQDQIPSRDGRYKSSLCKPLSVSTAGNVHWWYKSAESASYSQRNGSSLLMPGCFNIDLVADSHRSAAALNNPTCTWSGVLAPYSWSLPLYSNKVFVGGVPWDTSPMVLQLAFQKFGLQKIEVPGVNARPKHPRCPNQGRNRVIDSPGTDSAFCHGYVYAVFETSKDVRSLLNSCHQDVRNLGEYYFSISSRKMKIKDVQIIPWIVNDTNFLSPIHRHIKLSKEQTVFVGALHGMLTASGLARVMNDLFGDVVYAGIDTDKYKYPIGSGRVTFGSIESYTNAIKTAFVEIKTPKFVKKIQIDPYLEESLCSVCFVNPGCYFCRNESCFKYYCVKCWKLTHSESDGTSGLHLPMTRNSSVKPSAAVVRQLPEFKATELRPSPKF